MKLERHQTFPVAADILIAELTSRPCYEARYHMHGSHHMHSSHHMNSSNAEASFDLWQQTAAGLRIRICKQVQVKVEKLPALLRPFVAPEMPLYLEFFWRGHQAGQVRHRASADFRLWMGRAPLSVEGILEVTGQGDRSEQSLKVELISRIPLLGKKLLEKALPRVDALLEADYQATLVYLAKLG